MRFLQVTDVYYNDAKRRSSKVLPKHKQDFFLKSTFPQLIVNIY